MLDLLRNLRADDAGLALIEYTIAFGIIVAVSIVALTSTGSTLHTIFSSLSSVLTSAASGSG
jgi:Flp pilus assembly pilin Flp